MWDQSLKFLTKTNPQSFVSLLLDGAEYLGERDKEFQSRTIHADLVYEVQLIHHFRFRNLKLWEMDGSVLRQPGMEGMLPLLPLTRDGARREVVDEMISDLERVERQDLWPVGYCIAALVFPAYSENKVWLKERFKPLLHLFQESWAYHEMVDDSRKEGLQEGVVVLQKSCIRYVQKCFPTLVDQAKRQISTVGDIKRLHTAFDALMDATTAAEAEEILMHLSDEL